MKRIPLILFFLILLSVLSKGQNAINEYATINYERSFAGGLMIHSNGWGVDLQYYSNKDVKKNFIFNLDIISLEHPKETKILNAIYDDAKPYVYGKLNSIILLRPGIGNQWVIADKENPIGIRINANLVGGIDVGLLKPVYLDIIEDNKIVTERYDPVKHGDQGDIFGGAPFIKGINEISTTYGAFLKFSLSFEWSARESQIRALEPGVMIDFFPETLPIFAYIDNKTTYLNFYLNLFFGKRW